MCVGFRSVKTHFSIPIGFNMNGWFGKKTIGFASVGFHESSLQNSKMVKEIFKNDLLIVLVKI